MSQNSPGTCFEYLWIDLLKSEPVLTYLNTSGNFWPYIDMFASCLDVVRNKVKVNMDQDNGYDQGQL